MLYCRACFFLVFINMENIVTTIISSDLHISSQYDVSKVVANLTIWTIDNDLNKGVRNKL